MEAPEDPASLGTTKGPTPLFEEERGSFLRCCGPLRLHFRCRDAAHHGKVRRFREWVVIPRGGHGPHRESRATTIYHVKPDVSDHKYLQRRDGNEGSPRLSWTSSMMMSRFPSMDVNFRAAQYAQRRSHVQLHKGVDDVVAFSIPNDLHLCGACTWTCDRIASWAAVESKAGNL